MKTTLQISRAARAAAGALCLVTLGCSGSGSGTPGTGGSGNSGGGGNAGNTNALCPLEARFGGFAIALVEEEGNDPFSSMNGGVRNGVLPSEVWQQKGAAAGACRLIVGPTIVCTTACTSPQICAGQNQCIDSPTYQNLGVVTISGLGTSPIAVSPAQNFYTTSLVNPYPPFAPGAAVRVQAAGATGPAFTLDSVGIEPLTFAGTGLTLTNGQAFAFTWTPAATAGTARILATIEIGHHGGVAAQIDCDLPDTGSAEVPAALVSALIAEGVHGFPTLTVTRRTTVSTNVGAGCADLAIVSEVERPIGVCPTPGSCIVSCPEPGATTGCPTGQVCKAGYSCG
jgi:hypothetical protein